jgi:alkaline phosphatase D
MSFNSTVGRRPFMLGAVGILAGTAMAPQRLWAQPRLPGNPFTLGVASGDPWPDGFVIWTRLAPEPLAEHGGMPMLAVPVNWEVSEDENFARVVQKGVALARPELGHSVHVELAGLKPARHYFYRFHIEGGERSPRGRVRTAPPAGSPAKRVRIASVGCQHYEAGYFTAYAHLAREPDIDLVYHYGDYIYEGAGYQTAGRPAVGKGETGQSFALVRSHAGGEIYSLDDYRRRYAQYHMDPDLQAAHASAAFVMSYDDHEVDNDWAGIFDQDATPQEFFALRTAAALQAWYENLPVRRSQLPRQGGLQLYRRLDYGDLVRMHVLDTRAYRSKQLCGPSDKPGCRVEDDPSSTMLGAEQERWLGDSLNNKARWNFLAQQILFMPYDFRESVGGTYDHNKPWTGTDDWAGYPASQERVKRMIVERKLSNVVIGTGNSHRHIAGHVPFDNADWDGPAVAVEFMSSSISSSGDSDDNWKGLPTVLRNNPQMELMSLQRGYQVYDVTPRQWTTEIKVMDTVSRKGGQISTLAKFAVEPSRPKIERA